jgi:DNA modification methylase
MMGSGTVLALACSKGHQAIGIDIDPLAVLISKVWITAVDRKEILTTAGEVLDRARVVFSTLPTRDAYPLNADLETRRFVTYWFDDYVRRQLASLAVVIDSVADETVRDALWCAFSRLIITKQSGASLARDLSHSRPHRSFDRAPVKPFRKFMAAVNHVVKNCIDRLDTSYIPSPTVYRGDARHLPLDNESVDLVLTSPPYLNAIDYMRCSKFSLVWMGHSIAELRRLRSDSIGTEAGQGAAPDEEVGNIIADLRLLPRLRKRDESVLVRYIGDIRKAVQEVARVLSPHGRAVYVIGENTIRGTFIQNAMIVSAIAELSGLSLQERSVRTLPANRRYLPPPSSGSNSAAMDVRIRREVILKFEKNRPVGSL